MDVTVASDELASLHAQAGQLIAALAASGHPAPTQPPAEPTLISSLHAVRVWLADLQQACDLAGVSPSTPMVATPRTPSEWAGRLDQLERVEARNAELEAQLERHRAADRIAAEIRERRARVNAELEAIREREVLEAKVRAGVVPAPADAPAALPSTAAEVVMATFADSGRNVLRRGDLVEAGEVAGYTGSAITTALSRLVASGKLTKRSKGVYGLADTGNVRQLHPMAAD